MCLHVHVCLTTGAGVQASPALAQEPSGVGEAQAASPRLAAASPRSPKVRGAQSVLGTRPRYAVHPHRRRRTRTRCARARRGQFRAGKRQTRLGANRLLVVAWGSAGRSLAQVSASFAVFCDGRRTPRLRVLSLLRLGDIVPAEEETTKMAGSSSMTRRRLHTRRDG
mmetsp:Transcript_26225/g.38535  ORF Transcript_26225/g.38535 Transcript_26225/m.38535 type:complete len:167 (+) Transcript_26225:227-727(+)